MWLKMGFFDKVKKTFASKRMDGQSPKDDENIVNDEDIHLKNSQNSEIINNPVSTGDINDFKYILII